MPSEKNRTITFTVEVDYFGRGDERDRMLELRTVCAALHQAMPGLFRVTDDRGQRWVYDPFADDGHHEGHTEALRKL